MTPNGERADAPSHADLSDQRLDRPPRTNSRPISAAASTPLSAPRSAPCSTRSSSQAAVTLPLSIPAVNSSPGRPKHSRTQPTYRPASLNSPSRARRGSRSVERTRRGSEQRTAVPQQGLERGGPPVGGSPPPTQKVCARAPGAACPLPPLAHHPRLCRDPLACLGKFPSRRLLVSSSHVLRDGIS